VVAPERFKVGVQVVPAAASVHARRRLITGWSAWPGGGRWRRQSTVRRQALPRLQGWRGCELDTDHSQSYAEWLGREPGTEPPL